MFYYEDIAFRPVEERDIEAIRRLRNEHSTFSQLTDARMIAPDEQKRWYDGLAGKVDRAFFSVVKVDRDASHPVLTEGRLIGLIRCSEIDSVNRSICVGADVAPDLRGQGYGTKIFRALLRYLFHDLGFHRIWLLVLETNEIARRLYQNVGFLMEGRKRESIWRDGRWVDYISMSILAPEYYEKIRAEKAERGS